MDIEKALNLMSEARAFVYSLNSPPSSEGCFVLVFSSFQLFFQSMLVDEHMLDIQQELPHLSGCNHSCGISIKVEIRL